MSVAIVFETHALTEDNEHGRATGWEGGRLSDEGRRLAAELGTRRRTDGLAAVFTSDLARAVETAEIAFAGSGIPIHRDARLRECDYGTLTGMPVAQLEAERPLRVNEPFPEGESWRQAVERMGGFLGELRHSHDGRRVLVIGHVATKWGLDHFLNGAAIDELVRVPFEWQEGWEYVLP